MTVPTIAFGTPNHGTTGSVTYVLPAHQADDILLLFVECGQTTGVPTPPTGWAHVPNSPRAQGSNVEAGSLMWKRATSSSETNPVVPAQANHQVGVAARVRGAITSGNPYDTGGQGVNSNLSTSLSVALSSTTVADCLVVFLATSAADDTADQFGTFTNASLTSVTKQISTGTTDGNGGSVDVVTGVRATAGAAGTFAATQLTSTQWVGIGIAIMPATAATVNGTAAGTQAGTGTAVAGVRHPGTAAGTGAGTGTALGRVKHPATAAGTGAGTAAAAALVKHSATAAGTQAGTGSAVGLPKVTGTAAGTQAGSGSAAGTSFTPIGTVFGTAAGVQAGSAGAVGLVKRSGVASASQAGTGSAVARRITYATAAGAQSGTGAAVATSTHQNFDRVPLPTPGTPVPLDAAEDRVPVDAPEARTPSIAGL